MRAAEAAVILYMGSVSKQPGEHMVSSPRSRVQLLQIDQKNKNEILVLPMIHGSSD